MSSFEEQLKDSLSQAYEIERELGGGGMSRVFVARDRLLGRKVVIKLLSPELTAEVNRGRFRREIQVAAQLQHPHIVTLLSAGEHGELVYYTMPYIDGESLKSALEKSGRLSVPDVVRVLYDVVDALSYAHGQGVIHRDIKPGNILRSGSHALVTDFGVAKALNAAMASSGMTSTGMAIGTPAYMAPEQLAGDPSADHRIDIYALGLMSYELLVGQSPFAGISPQQVLAAVLTRDPKPLHEVRKDVPRKLSQIIMSCLSKVPGGRPSSAEALLDSLDTIATASGEIRTKEHKIPPRHRTPSVIVPAIGSQPATSDPSIPIPAAAASIPIIAAPIQSLLSDPAVPAMQLPPQRKSRGMLYAAAAIVLIAGVAGATLISKKSGVKAPVAPPQAASAETPPQTVVANAAMTTPAPAPVVIDSNAIAAAVTERLAKAQAEKKTKDNPINADSLRRAVQREMRDSIARVNAKNAAAAAAAAAAPATNTATPPVSAPAATNLVAAPASAPAPAAAAPPPGPTAAGKKRLAITSPRENPNPALNAFTRQFIDALRASLGENDEFDAIDQDVVRDVQSRTANRDEAAKVLKPDVMVWPGYAGTGDTVNVVVTVWDLRSSSSYGIRVTTAKVVPSNSEHYLAPLIQSVMKQLSDLSKTPTIYRKQ